MSHKVKGLTNSDLSSCEKYLTKMLRQECVAATRKSPIQRSFQDKFSHLMKQPNSGQSQRLKTKLNCKQQSPLQKGNAHLISGLHKDPIGPVRGGSRSPKRRQRSTSRSRSNSKVRDSWGKMLLSNKSKEKVSNFSNFDPLRTLHFLSKELFTKLSSVMPDEEEILQMVSDIQHALKRIPPEVTTLLHRPQIEDSESNNVDVSLVKNLVNKICQTPPTLYQEDTERFQKIMEENTFRLEASCKQLEVVCANLQAEKEMTEKELEEAKENVEFLCKRVKDLEQEIGQMSNMKIKELEEEKNYLQEQLEKAHEDVSNNPSFNHMKRLVEDLKKQKNSADETCAHLEYDMTILKMEKEKLATMLAVRDKEIKEIQDEMSKIQEQVNKQLKKFNTDLMDRANSMKMILDPFTELPDNLFLEIGDTTLSSITTNESEKDSISIIKESPCGDTELIGKTKDSHDNILTKLQTENVQIDLLSSNKEGENIIENIMSGFSPSIQALLHNV